MPDTGREELIPQYVKDIKTWSKKISGYLIRVQTGIESSSLIDNVAFDEQGYLISADGVYGKEHSVQVTKIFNYNSRSIHITGGINFCLKEDRLNNEELKFYLNLQNSPEEIPIFHRWKMGGRVCGKSVDMIGLRLDESNIQSAISLLSKKLYDIEIKESEF